MRDVHHPELFHEADTYFITWMEEVKPGIWGRIQLDISKAHYDQLRIWPESALERYVQLQQHKGYRIQTDGQYTPGRRRSGEHSKKDSGETVDAVQRSNGKPTSRHAVEPVRRTGDKSTRVRSGKYR
jgi:hypothetical protein